MALTNNTLQVLMYQWLITFKRADVSSRTFERDLGTARLHIYPCVGDMKPADVDSHVIQRLLNNMILNNGYSLATARKVKFLLNQFFTYVKKKNFFSENSVADCRIKSAKEHKEYKEDDYKAIPIAVRKKFFAVINSHAFFAPICMVQLFGSMRIGEALAIKWKDFV